MAQLTPDFSHVGVNRSTALCEAVFQWNKAHAGKAQSLKWSVGRVHQARARSCTFGTAPGSCTKSAFGPQSSSPFS